MNDNTKIGNFNALLEDAADLKTLGYSFKEAIPILKENHPNVIKMTVQQLTNLKQVFKRNEDAEFFAKYAF